MSRIISFDTETFYDKEVTVTTLGAWKYARHPKAECYLVSVADGSEVWAGHPRDFNFDSLTGAEVVSHNAAFDQEIYLAGVEAGRWPLIQPARWHCTANMAAFLCNRRSLDAASEHLLGVRVSKAMRNYMKGRTWADAVADGKADDLLQYAKDDAILCRRLFVEHGDKWPEHERRLSELTIDQGRVGVHVHRERLEAALTAIERVIEAAKDKLPWIAQGRADASPIAIAEACRAAGIPPMPVKAHDADGAVEWEEIYSPQLPWVKGLKDLRKAKRTRSILQTMLLRLRDDDSMAFSLKYFGAHTGRWAGDGGLNFQNFPRQPLYVTSGYELSDGPSEGGGTEVDLRGLLIPPPGMQLAAADLSQIEPRVLNKLVGNEPFLEKIRAGFAIYEAHARDSMGWTGGKLKEEAPRSYGLAKARVLGLGYGCGWRKFITVAQIMGGINITEDDEPEAIKRSHDGRIYTAHPTTGEPLKAPSILKLNRRNELVWEPVYGVASRTTVEDFRATNPLNTGFWRDMDDALSDAASQGEDLAIELPSGRSLRYENVKREYRTFSDPDEPEVKQRRVVLTAVVGGIRSIFYGGLIVENITQAVARDVFAHNVLLLVDAGIQVIWTVHDEAVCAVKDEAEAEKARRIMATVPPWLEGCPIDAEVVISDRYTK